MRKTTSSFPRGDSKKETSSRQQQTTECPLSPWAGRKFARPVERSSLCCQSETRLALSVSSTISTRAGSSQAQMLRADRSEIAESAMHKHSTEYRNQINFAKRYDMQKRRSHHWVDHFKDILTCAATSTEASPMACTRAPCWTFPASSLSSFSISSWTSGGDRSMSSS